MPNVACPSRIVTPSLQLVVGGATGGVDCLAHSTSDAIDWATCGHTDPNGRTIRLMSSEPKPDLGSPGLNLYQVAEVAIEHYGVYLDVHAGPEAITWAKYEAARKEGRGCVLQVGYAPIADSRYDAGHGFRGGHGMFEYMSSTEDPLADGRYPSVYDRRARGPVVYDRNLIRRAAEHLIIARGHSGNAIFSGSDNIWCALTRDTIPHFAATIRPKTGRPTRTYRAYNIDNGVITGFRRVRTRGFVNKKCSIPRTYTWPNNDDHKESTAPRVWRLVQIQEGKHTGEWVNQKFSHEV